MILWIQFRLFTNCMDHPPKDHSCCMFVRTSALNEWTEICDPNWSIFNAELNLAGLCVHVQMLWFKHSIWFLEYFCPYKLRCEQIPKFETDVAFLFQFFTISFFSLVNWDAILDDETQMPLVIYTCNKHLTALLATRQKSVTCITAYNACNNFLQFSGGKAWITFTNKLHCRARCTPICPK